MSPLPTRPARAVRRIPRRWPRSTVPWWSATLLLAALTAATVHGALGRAADAEARWRTTRSVLVATRPLAIGDGLAGRVERRRLPVAAVPDQALGSVAPGRVAMQAIGRGEVVTAARVSGQRAGGVAAVLPLGTRAVVIPLAVAGLPVQPGDHVDLLGTATGSAGATVAANALVVAASGKSLVVAIPAAAVAPVARSLGQGSLVPALVGPGG